MKKPAPPRDTRDRRKPGKKLQPDEALVNEAFARQVRMRRCKQRGLKPRKHPSTLPTPEQLANLAATMARTSQETPDKLCASALNLWFTSIETIVLQKQFNEDWGKCEAQKKAKPQETPSPDGLKFPINRDKFLQRCLPKKKSGDRAEIAKGWLKDKIKCQPGKTPTKSQVEAEFAKLNEIDKPRFFILGEQLRIWHQGNRKEKISEVRRTAGKASGEKRRASKAEKAAAKA